MPDFECFIYWFSKRVVKWVVKCCIKVVYETKYVGSESFEIL